MLAAAELFRAHVPYLDCLKCAVVNGVKKVAAGSQGSRGEKRNTEKTFTDGAQLTVIAHYRWM